MMSQSIIYTLLLFALVLPIVGAIALRLLSSRLSPTQLYSAAGGLLVVVLASVLLLERSDAPSLQIGSLSVLLPVTAPEDVSAALPAEIPTTSATLEEPTAESGPRAEVTTAPALTTVPATPTAAATVAPTPVATEAPTPTAAPTAEPTAAPTAEPTGAPTAAPPPASQPQKYTVQAGDTLRSIAEKFNVSVTTLIDANKLTPAEADSLRVGQELVIPAP